MSDACFISLGDPFCGKLIDIYALAIFKLLTRPLASLCCFMDSRSCPAEKAVPMYESAEDAVADNILTAISELEAISEPIKMDWAPI